MGTLHGGRKWSIVIAQRSVVYCYLMVHVDSFEDNTQSNRFKLLGSEFWMMVSQ